MVVELKPHQEQAVDKLGNGKILYGGTGVGKSITAVAYFVSKVCKGTYNDYGSMRTPKDLYVITTAKKRDDLDWHGEAVKFGISTDREASPDGIKLTVDSWNNIGKYEEVEDAFFIFDEQRLVGSGAWTKSFYKIAKRNEWILLSATPGDNWIDYIPVFVANGFYKNRTHFKQDHVIYNTYGKFPKVDRYVGVGKLVRLRNQLLVHMPYDRHTKRHIHNVPVSYDKALFDKVVKERWHVFEQRPIRDVAELFAVMRKVVNSDASRLDTLRGLMDKHPKLIVFYNFDYELEILRTLISPDQKASPESIEELAQKINRKRLDSVSSMITTPITSNGHPTSTKSISTQTHTTGLERLHSCTKQNETSDSRGPSSGMSTQTCLCTPGTTSSRSEKTTGEPTCERSTDQMTALSMTEMSQSDCSQDGSGQKRLATVGATSQTTSGGPTSKTLESSSKQQLDILSSIGSGTGSSSSLKASDSCEMGVDSSGRQELNKSGRKTSNTPTSALKISSDGLSIPYAGSPYLMKSSASTGTTPVNLQSGPSNTGSDHPSSSVTVAEWNGHKHERIPKTDRWVYLVQYAAGAEGWNCVETDAMVFYSLTYSYKHFFQGQGRIDRLNTPFIDLHYYVLKSDALIDKAISRSLKAKKSFNERDLEL